MWATRTHDVEVGGGDVRPSPEPPHASVGLEVAVVEVHRGAHGVLQETRMTNNNDDATAMTMTMTMTASKPATLYSGHKGVSHRVRVVESSSRQRQAESKGPKSNLIPGKVG